MTYADSYQNQSVVEQSKLGISCNGDTWDKELVVIPDKIQYHSTDWTPVYGERELSRDQYNESVINVIKENRNNAVLQLFVRSYDSGIVFRHQFAENKNGRQYLHITD